MQIEVLHTTLGDKSRKYDTSTEAGCKQASDMITKLMKAGTAILLERGRKTYYVKDYDPKTDKLTVTVERKGKAKQVKASGKKSKAVAVPRVAGGTV